MLLQVSRHCHKHKEPSAGKGTRDISKSIYSRFYFCFWEQVDFTCVGFPFLCTVIRMSEILRKGCQGLVQRGPMFCLVALGASLGSLLFLSFDNSHVHSCLLLKMPVTPHNPSNVFIHWRPQVCHRPQGQTGMEQLWHLLQQCTQSATEQHLETPPVCSCALNPDLLLSLHCVGMRDGGGGWRALTALLSDPAALFTLLLPHDQIHPGAAQGVLAVVVWSLPP